VIVADASAAIAALVNEGAGRQLLAAQQVHVPHLIDSEIVSGLRRLVAAKQLSTAHGWQAIDTWQRLGVTRYPAFAMLERVWELRDNVSAYDATYVALAELLGCALVTADGRLAGAPNLRCSVTVVPR